MKGLRSILVLAFMFTLIVNPVQAKAGERYGFIPLITKVNNALPLRQQAQEAFERLLPQLQALQKSGTVLDFEPELNAGILKIKYVANITTMSLDGKQIYDDINVAAATVPYSHKAGMQTAIFSPVFRLNLYESCFFGINMGVNKYVVGTLHNSANIIMANFKGNSDPDGYLSGCFNYMGPSSNVVPSYKVTFRVYNQVGSSLLGTYSATARNIVINSIDTVNGIINGTALANKPYSISWYHQNYDAARTSIYGNLNGTVSGNATWVADFGTTSMRGSDSLSIEVTQSNRFSFNYGMSVPYSSCKLGGDICNIYGLRFQPASLTITHANVPYTFTGKFNKWGLFSANLEDSNGIPILLAPGDTVEGTGIPAYQLPNLTTYIHYSTDIITGKAPANKYFDVDVYDSYTGSGSGLWAHSDINGNYSANFSSIIDIRTTDILTFAVYYSDNVTGNNTYRYFPINP